MIRSHIGFMRNFEVVLKLDIFFYLLDRSFGLGSFIGFGYLSLLLSLRAGV